MPIIFASQMVLQTPATSGGNGNLPPFPLTHARIGYDTIATEDNVTASSEAEQNDAVARLRAGDAIEAEAPLPALRTVPREREAVSPGR